MISSCYHNTLAARFKRTGWSGVWLLLVLLICTSAPNLALALDDCEQETSTLHDEPETSSCIECEHFACACQLSVPAPILRAQAPLALPATASALRAPTSQNVYLNPLPERPSRPPRA